MYPVIRMEVVDRLIYNQQRKELVLLSLLLFTSDIRSLVFLFSCLYGLFLFGSLIFVET